MKVRDGFVSNSSSTAFILDLRKRGAGQVELHNIDIRRPCPGDFGRTTCFGVRKDVVAFANSYVGDHADDYKCTCLGHWILGWIEKLGVENIGFARDSDEGMGGRLGRIDHIAVAEMEYH